MTDRLRALFKAAPAPVATGEPKDKGQEETAPLETPVAWAKSDSMAWMTRFDGLKYNPDDLLTRKGFEIYKRMMTDEQVKAVVRFKLSAIISRKWYFTCDDDALGEEECARRIKLFERIVERMGGGFPTGLNMLLRCLWQGFSITEKVHDRFTFEGLTYIGLKKFKPRPFESFRFKTDDYGNIQSLVQQVSGKEERDVPLDRVVYMVHNADIDEHYGQSDLREAYRHYFIKDMTIRFGSIYAERIAGGFISVEPETTLTENSKDYQAVKAFLTNASATTGVLLPGKCTLKVHYPTATDHYEKAEARCNLAIAKALLVPNLLGISEAGQTGAFAQSKTQFEAFLWTLGELTNALTETLNEQVFAELGRMNFADGIAPRIEFEALSDERKLELLKLWKDLVGSKAVQATDTDEKHIRDQMDFPEAGEPINQPAVAIDPKTGLPLEPGAKPDQGGKPGDSEAEDDEEELTPSPAMDETLIGRQLLKARKQRLARAEKRVAFAVIEKRTLEIEGEARSALLRAVGESITSLMRQFDEADELKPENVTAAKFSSEDRGRISRVLRSTLKDSWSLGQKHAADEVGRARKGGFSVDMERLGNQAAKFFDAKAFTITGKLTEDALSVVRLTISQGIKEGWSVDETRREVYSALTRAGFLDRDEMAEALDLDSDEGRAVLDDLLGDAGLTPARLNTIIRTNTFEAFNEARYSYFTDPALNNFVEAMEYSAVLDENTTDICEALDGEVWASDSDVLDTHRPPNHFNCRSLLVPIVQGDSWSDSGTPAVKPQDGF